MKNLEVMHAEEQSPKREQNIDKVDVTKPAADSNKFVVSEYRISLLLKGEKNTPTASNEKQFEVLTDPLSQDQLDNIREKIAWFIMCEVINKNGEFHC